MRLTMTLALLWCLTMGALAAPLQNGGFDGAGGAPWQSSTNSQVSFGGQATVSVVNLPPTFGTSTPTDIVNAVNAATSFNSAALGGLTGVGSFMFQTFDRVSGNAGDVIEYTISGFSASGLNAFAYFLDVTNSVEQLVTLSGNGSDSFQFQSGGTNLLVGFGLLRPNATTGAFSFVVDNVNQVPEIDASAATLPLAILLFAAFIVVDSRRKSEARVATPC